VEEIGGNMRNGMEYVWYLIAFVIIAVIFSIVSVKFAHAESFTYDCNHGICTKSNNQVTEDYLSNAKIHNPCDDFEKLLKEELTTCATLIVMSNNNQSIDFYCKQKSKLLGKIGGMFGCDIDFDKWLEEME